MLKNRNLARDARKRVWSSVPIAAVTNTLQDSGFVDMECDIRILRIDVVYLVASGANEDSSINVGIPGTVAKYLAYAIEDSKAIGFIASPALASSAIVAKGTPVIVRRPAGADADGTAVTTAVITYERLDQATTN